MGAAVKDPMVAKAPQLIRTWATTPDQPGTAIVEGRTTDLRHALESHARPPRRRGGHPPPRNPTTGPVKSITNVLRLPGSLDRRGPVAKESISFIPRVRIGQQTAWGHGRAV